MMTQLGSLNSIPNDTPADALDLLQYARRVAELIRISGTLEHWRQKCHESFEQSRERLETLEAWNKRRLPYVWNSFMRQQSEQSILNWISEGNPCCAEEEESGDATNWIEVPEILFLPDGSRNLVWATVPPESADDQEPYADGPLPLSSRHSLSLADCYFVHALIYDAVRRDAAKINPFSPDEKYPLELTEEVNFWNAQSALLSQLRLTDQVTLDDCLARVQDDLAQLTAPPRDASSGRSAQLDPTKIPKEFEKPLRLWEQYRAEMERNNKRAEIQKFVEWARSTHTSNIDLRKFKLFLDRHRKAIRRRQPTCKS